MVGSRPLDPLHVILAPIDQGVRNVGGRDGAREGPRHILEGLRDAGRLDTDVPVHRLQVENTPESLESDLDGLSDAVEDILEEGGVPLVLGGDHGTTYATVRGAARAIEDVGVTYLDVHFDLRDHDPVHTSGSSFRRLIEEGWVRAQRVVPIGIEEPRTSQARERSDYDALERWAREQGIDWVPLETARSVGPDRVVQERMREGGWCVSLDADAIDERFAPGVSAPGSGRFTPDEARAFLHAAAERGRVFDVVEYAPRLDEGGRTLETLVDVLGPLLER